MCAPFQSATSLHSAVLTVPMVRKHQLILSFFTCASALISEPPPSSIAHLPHPPRSFFPPSELFLSPPTLQHLLFPNHSTSPPREPLHGCVTSSSPSPAFRTTERSLSPSTPTWMSSHGDGQKLAWAMEGSKWASPGKLNPAERAQCSAVGLSRTPTAGGQEMHQEGHPWARAGTSSGAVTAAELREAGEMRQSSSKPSLSR